MNGTAESCSNCRFWYKDQTGTVCRRFPPHSSFVQGTPLSPPSDVTTWSRTLPGQWCGEWKADVPGGGLVSVVPMLKTNQPQGEVTTPITQGDQPPDPPSGGGSAAHDIGSG